VQQHSQRHHANTPDSAVTAPRSEPPGPATVAELRVSGHEYRGVKDEIRQNLLAKMRAGQDPFPGIVGFGQTVLPHLERALIAGHDLILLGERGQGKTRLIRTLGGLLDEWTPVIEGCEINDHPYHRPAHGAGVSPPSWVTTCRSAGGTPARGTARNSPPPTPAWAT
jgi:hypothetical protein